MMHLDFDDTLPLGLHGYVRQVCGALGMRGDCSYVVQTDEPVSAYIALDERLAGHPDHDVALLWDGRHGWAAAIEGQSREDLVVVAALGQDLLPVPDTVAAWARDLFDGRVDALPPGEHPVLPGADTSADTVRRRLSAYVGTALTGPRVPGPEGEELAIA